jgi:plastocyanin
MSEIVMREARRIFMTAAVFSILFGWGIGRSAEIPPEKSAPPSRPAVVTIRIVTDAQDRCDKAYDPDVVTITAGTTVAWINQDYETHTLVGTEGSDPCNPKELGPNVRLIDVGQIPPHKEYRQIFRKVGEYPYGCHLPFHHMSGKIIVVP